MKLKNSEPTSFKSLSLRKFTKNPKLIGHTLKFNLSSLAKESSLEGRIKKG